MCSASSRDGALRKRERGNCGRQLRARRAFFSCPWNPLKINASSLDGTLFVATSVDATQSLVDSSWRWNKINASSRDGTLFVATSVDAKTMQRNALCSVNSQTFRGAGTSEFAGRRATLATQARPRVGRASTQRIVQRDFAHFSWRWNKCSASSLDGALSKRDRGRFRGLRGRFAHAHYRFRKRALLVPSRCDLIPADLTRGECSLSYLFCIN